jgi:hypothetical protein
MSRRPAFLGLALLACALGGVIVLELDAARPAVDETGIVPIRHAPRARARAPSEDPEDHTDQWVATAVARPLFSRDRRPTPVSAASGGGPAQGGLPRLTGVVIGPFGRTAIFAGPDGARPVAVAEGKTLGAYTVRAIAPGQVTVTGPDGERVVTPVADAATRSTLAAPAPPAPAIPPGLPPGTLPSGLLPGAPLSPQQRATLLNPRPGTPLARGMQGLRNPATQEGSD